ncbi:MAG TPA: nicotinamide riboside transporter PnuC [Gemmatimonadaceae bacterium]|nr:nicotinamide riboside transporter PnuC [Gemmatimonadaceae bacterium]
MSSAEIAANALNTAAIVLAGRNSVHTWWTGILGCGVFAWVFYGTQLYADVTLQVFFIGSSVVGWWRWRRTREHLPVPVRFTQPATVAGLAAAGVVTTLAYGWLLYRFTNAYAPFLDSVVLAFSVIGTFLLVDRRVESWWCWLIVNTVAVPLYASRTLYLTAALYAVYWVNAVIALRCWWRLAQRTA